MAESKLYKWIWEWSDYGDKIIDSNQLFSSRQLCQFDALRHYPYVRAGDWKGRTGTPEARIVEEDALEYRWILVIYDEDNWELARYSEDIWYDTCAQCVNATRKLNVDPTETGSYAELEFETRLKQCD